MSKKRVHKRCADIHCGIGDKVNSRKYGNGVVIGVSDDPEFRYNVSFEDGTKIWYDGRATTIVEKAAS